MTFPQRILSLAAALTALSSVASGYYHFVYFVGRGAPFTPINLQFDLSRQANNTVYYFVSDQGPDVFVPGDSFTAVISELQLAAQAWNGIPSSLIQLQYGGLESASTQQSAPGIDVVFDDSNIAPGILAQTKVTTYSNVNINGTTTFLPILRSRIQLRKNLTVTVPQQASFYDSSFTTMVHEFGHALGLQHTLTSACMSTYTTRSTTKAIPLAADDIAGISLLYPAPGYLATTGSISGTVTLNGSGVNLASVVALSPTTGAAISTLTNPDGTYQIDAIPPGNYLLYVHPLPPAAQGEAGPDAIVLPLDSSQNPFPPANTGFVTQFLGGTRDWTQTQPVAVSPSTVTSNQNFNVQGSAGPVVYGMQLSGYLTATSGPEASPMLPANGAYSLVFTAPGTTTGSNQLAPGLNVSVIGSPAASVVPNYTKFWQQYNGLPFVLMGIYTASVQPTTPVALAVTVSNDLYVLPAAFFVVPSGAPTISILSTNTDVSGNATVKVAGSALSNSTRFVFDGTLAAASQNGDGSFTLAVPPAPGPYSSSIEALNTDGQTSGQANPFGVPLQYVYNYANPATINLSQFSVVPGTDAMIQITGNGTNFNSQTTVVGFGSSDIVVKQVFVENSGFLLVNVSVNPFAPPTLSTVTVTTGLQTATLNASLGQGIQILAANPTQISLHAPVTNAATGLPGVPTGGTAAISVSGLPATTSANMPGWTLTIGGQPASPLLVNGGQVINAAVPGGLTPGTAIVRLTSPTGAIIPAIFMTVISAPPVIASVLGATGPSAQQVNPGDVLTLNILQLMDPQATAPLTASNIVVTAGGVNIPILLFNNPQIQIQIPFSMPAGTNVPLTVGVGPRVSAPVYLNIQ